MLPKSLRNAIKQKLQATITKCFTNMLLDFDRIASDWLPLVDNGCHATSNGMKCYSLLNVRACESNRMSLFTDNSKATQKFDKQNETDTFETYLMVQSRLIESV